MKSLSETKSLLDICNLLTVVTSSLNQFWQLPLLFQLVIWVIARRTCNLMLNILFYNLAVVFLTNQSTADVWCIFVRGIDGFFTTICSTYQISWQFWERVAVIYFENTTKFRRHGIFATGLRDNLHGTFASTASHQKAFLNLSISALSQQSLTT